ncbi:MAG: site-2 protease family protein [Pyrinomonadaceae bacterium]
MTSDEQVLRESFVNRDTSGAATTTVAPLLASATHLRSDSHRLVTRRSTLVTAFKFPTTREWVRHTGLLLLTLLTTTFSGVMLAIDQLPEPALAEPARWLDYFTHVPTYYILSVAGVVRYAFAHPEILAEGVIFSLSLLAILLAHEAGHYVACRRYGVAATLPFFLPAPPMFLAGTFGAFIKIKSPIPTRRALFDIGVAGPLAGFAVIIPVAVAAVLTTQPAPPLPPLEAGGEATSLIFFHEQPLFRLLYRALGVQVGNAEANPFFFAAWIGLLVTSLNLLPVGQLDGGHAVFAVLGPRAHKWIGRAAFVVMAASAILGWTIHHTPSGFLYALLLLVLLRLPHPQAEDETEPLGRSRLFVAAVTLAVFLLSFELFPISIS